MKRAVQQALGIVPHLAGVIVNITKQLGAVLVASKLQSGLVIVNVFFLTHSLHQLRRARFAASVRVVKDLTRTGRREDLELILDNLPPWISFPEWERAESMQTFLSLLWPALNTELCKLLKHQIESRLQEHSDFGHVVFTRMSFGRQPPSIVGTKAVPLVSEDLLAMVLDLDVRWSGEPDMVLRLSKMGGASLALHGVQIAGILRVVISPIREEPPFITRLTLSLLKKPYVDFNLRALGGPDLMALPAVSTWLHRAVLTLAGHTIVLPKQVVIDWDRGRFSGEGRTTQGEDSDGLSGSIPPPLGVLTIEVDSAQIEKRRSTFLGRWKTANPRVALLLPPPEGESGIDLATNTGINNTATGGINTNNTGARQQGGAPNGGGGVNEEVASAPDGVPTGVTQAGLTPPRPQTLTPEWSQRFKFAVISKNQVVRLLLSHQRMEIFGADMPLGVADVPLIDVLGSSDGSRNTSTTLTHSASQELFPTLASPLKDARQKERATTNVSTPPMILRRHSHTPDIHTTTPDRAPNSTRALSRLNTMYESASSGDSVASSSSVQLTRLLSAVSRRSYDDSSTSSSVSHESEDEDNDPEEEASFGAWDTGANNNEKGSQVGVVPAAAAADKQRSRKTSRRASRDEEVSSRFRSLTVDVDNDTETVQQAVGYPRRLSMEDESIDTTGFVVEQEGDIAQDDSAVYEDATDTLLPISSSDDEGPVPVQGVPESTSSPPGGGAIQQQQQYESKWLRPNGVWVVVPTTNSVTLPGMVSEALASRSRLQASGSVNDNGGWLGSLQHLLGTTDDDEWETTTPSAENSAGRVLLKLKWAPTEQRPQRLASPFKKPRGRRARGGAADKDIVQGSDNNDNTGNSAPPSPEKQAKNTAAMNNNNEDINNIPIPTAPPTPAPSVPPPQPGILAVRVAHTTLDYGQQLNNPVLAIGVVPKRDDGPSAAQSGSSLTVPNRHRVMSMDCSAGSRPGLLHWGQVFYVPVDDAGSGARALIELGNASSGLKLSSYGVPLYCLDSCESFESNVDVEASAYVPLRDVMALGSLRATWRLREGRGLEADRLDVGRVVVQLAWFPEINTATDQAVNAGS